MMQEEYLTPNEICGEFRVTAAAIRYWIRQGLLPASRIPGTRRWLIKAADVEKLREQRDETA